MANTSTDVITYALSQKGYKGGEVFWKSVGFSSRVPWCAIFVSRCARKSDVSKSVIPDFISVSQFLDFAKQKNRFNKNSSHTPKKGDIFILKGKNSKGSQVSHVGYVTSATGNEYRTIEGNYSDKVWEVTRKYSDKALVGFFSPEYSDSAKTVSTSSNDVSEKTTELDSASDETKKKKEITTSIIKSIIGSQGKARGNPISNINVGLTHELFLVNLNDEIIMQAVKEGIIWETQRKGVPGKLSFSVIKDSNLNFTEGDRIIFKVNSVGLFYGFIFEKVRNDNNTITVTAYDQLRYLKNKDCYIYKNKKASEFISMISKDFNLICGDVEDTGYVIPQRVEDNSTLFDMIQSAFDITLIANGRLYVLYDDFGKLAVKNVKQLTTNYVVDNDTIESIDYVSSIDQDTYNRIKLYNDNSKTGEREIYIRQDETNINKWGVLQYCDTLQEGENANIKTNLLLSIYNNKKRSLSVKNAIGNINVRAGCSVFVSLNLGDVIHENYMICESVTHNFKNDYHSMNMQLIGGDGFE